MNISQAIVRLQMIKEEYGDIEVYVEQESRGDTDVTAITYNPVRILEFPSSTSKWPERVVIEI